MNISNVAITNAVFLSANYGHHDLFVR